MTGPAVPGLLIQYDFITKEKEEELISTLRSLSWPERKGRLAIHYGYTFNYKTMGIDEGVPYISFPIWLENIFPVSVTGKRPDQVCVQYYAPGTGIPPHVDTHSVYDELFALSIGAPVTMDFKKDGRVIEVDLAPRSMIQMTGEARYHWTHGIKKRKRDIIEGRERPRGDRWSVTYRWLRGTGECECGNDLLCDSAQRRNGTEKKFRWQDEKDKDEQQQQQQEQQQENAENSIEHSHV